MKPYLVFLFSLALSSVFGQINLTPDEYLLPIDSITRKVKFVEVVETINSKGVLYRIAQKWAAKRYNSYKNVVQTENSDLGLLVIKGTYYEPQPASIRRSSSSIIYVITIECKDKKYRATIDDFAKKTLIGDAVVDFSVDNRMVDGIEADGKPMEKNMLDRFKAQNALLKIEMTDLLISLKYMMVQKDDF